MSNDAADSRPWFDSARPSARAARPAACGDDSRREGGSALPRDDHRRTGRHARRRRTGVRAPLERGVHRRPQADALQPVRRAGRGIRHRPLAERPAGARARDATRHPRHDLERPTKPLQRQPGCGDPVRTFLAVARAARPRGDPRCRPRGAVRRHRPPGIHRGRHPGRPAPAGRPRDRVSLGTPAADVRRRCPADRRTRRGVHPRFPGRRARHHLRRHDDEALPRWRAAAGRRRPALRVRPRAGLSGRAVRPAPDPLRGGVRSRRPARSCPTTACRSAPSTTKSGSRSTRPSSRGCCASATDSTASCARTGASSTTVRSWGTRTPPGRGVSST